MSHSTIFAVLAALPLQQQAFWGIAGTDRTGLEALMRKGSFDTYAACASPAEYPFPDMERRLPRYSYPTDKTCEFGLNNAGRLFHYLPIDTDLAEGCGSWQSDCTEKWRFVDWGFRQYLKMTLADAAQGDRQGALIDALLLCHFLQDQTAFFHSMEGEEGTCPMIFDELFERPEGFTQTPTMLLGEFTPDFSMNDYRPQLLGASVAEASFHLYQKYRWTKRRNRQALVPLVQAAYAKNQEREAEIRIGIGRRTAELTYDLLHTLHRLAGGGFTIEELAPLRQVGLEELFPINYPKHLSMPYRFNAIVKNHALGSDGKPTPLRLMVNGTMREFKTGLAMGSHRSWTLTYAVPAGVFKRFTGHLGLLAESGAMGGVDFKLSLDEKPLLEGKLDPEHPCAVLDCDVAAGGMLSFQFRGGQVWNNPSVNVVLAEPMLVKPL